MNFLFHYFFSIVFIFNSIIIYSQSIDTTAFNADNRELLLKEIETVLTQLKREDCQTTLDELKKSIKKGSFGEDHYNAFLSLSNVMVKRKMKRYNYIQPLLEIILRFSDNTNESAQYLQKWLDLSIEVLNGQDPKKPFLFENYMKWAYEFWINGNLYKKSAGSHTWKVEGKDFNISFIDNEIKITYSNATLHCFNKNDSMTLKEANFSFFPTRPDGGFFEFKKAIVEWNQEGAKDAKCELSDFNFNARETAYRAEKAKLIYPSLFKLPMDGIFSDRTTKRHILRKTKDKESGLETEAWETPKNLTYPRFASLSRNIKIEDIGEGVDYFGGFRLEGSTVRGYGDENGRSYINITNRDKKLCVSAIGTEFDIFKGERVVSTDAAVTLFLPGEDGIDSIYHPNIYMVYNIKKRELELTRGKTMAGKVPFYNSLLESEMNTSYIRWPIDSVNIFIGNSEENMNLNSNKFFDVDKNTKYISITTINPIIKFAVYSEKLEESHLDRLEDRCNEYSDVSPDEWEEPESIDELCARDPSQCPDWYLEEMERKKNNPEETIVDTELDEVPVDSSNELYTPPPFNSKRISVEELLALLDKRMEKLSIVSYCEIIQIKKKRNPSFKIIKSYKDWKDFERNYPLKYKFGFIDAADVLSFTNDVIGPQHSKSNGMALIQDMIGDGFVTYDYKEDVVVLREKLFHYKNSVNRKMLDYDYDRIQINSAPQKAENNANAVLDISKKSMETSGVQSFVLSEARNVWAEPHAQKVNMKKNRDMDFDGTMYAGLLKFTGKSFQFQYDSFQVEMDTIDYINFFIFERDQWKKEENAEFAGFYKPTRKMNGDLPSEVKMSINNPIYNTSGKLIIDISNNKSGKLPPDPKLPSFESTDTGYVYYERLNRMNQYQDMIYSRHKFYYKVDPFKIEAVDRYEPSNLVFSGSFHSADIMPIVKDSLRVMYHDLSFGFEAETPADGFPIYLGNDPKGKGKYTGIFGISNQGLIGRGKLNFLGASIESDYIEFLPEQFLTDRVDSFSIQEQLIDGVEFPNVYGDSVFIDWLPYEDSMFIETDLTKNSPFRFYDTRDHNLTGLLHLTKKGLMGHGTFEWEEGKLKSNPTGELVFGKKSVKSETAIFEIKKPGEELVAFKHENASVDLDFEKKTAIYISDPSVMTDLPFNQYKTQLDKFTWDMEKKTVLIESTSGESGQFLALGEGQDSLSFDAPKAIYDIELGAIKIDGVENIRVADAFIIPKGGRVDVAGSATLKSFEDARIIADTSNQNHQILKANIQIASKSEYTATGYLEFNVEDFKEQEILFKEIKVIDGITTGSGTVDGQDSFYLDKGSMFKGDIEMNAQSKNLDFKGYAKLISDAIPLPQWFSIKSRIDKKNVMIDYSVPENQEGEKLYVGLFLSLDSLYVYPRILATKFSSIDRPIFTSEGLIMYDENKKIFNFGDSAKVVEPWVNGNLLSISEKDSMVNINGRFDFNKGFNGAKLPEVSVYCAGDINFKLEIDSAINYIFNTAMLIDIPIPDILSNLLIQDLTSSEESIEKIMYSSSSNVNMKSRLSNIIRDDNIISKMWEKAEDENFLIVPNELKHSFIIPQLELRWSEKTQSFISKGKLNLSHIKAKHIGQKISGTLEIMPDPIRGDIITFYFNSPNGDWYFFQYTNGIMTTASSNVNYMTTLSGLKKKDLKLKTPNGESVEILPGNSAQYSIFKEKTDTAF